MVAVQTVENQEIPPVYAAFYGIIIRGSPSSKTRDEYGRSRLQEVRSDNQEGVFVLIQSEKNYAVYTEKALEVKPMEIEWNRRVFNTTEVENGTAISCDDEGIIALAPGTYHIQACSIVNYFPDLSDLSDTSASTAPDEPDDPIEKSIHPGYCMLRFHPGQKAITTGTISNADYMLPSIVDTFLQVEETVQIKLEHQVGGTPEDVEDVYLQVGGNISTNHVFARISIEKLD